jgi:Cu-Zn family superoxide dismutase
MQNVKGELVFSQLFPTFPVMISGRISGLAPGEHAFHIHEFGDLREGCIKAGDHYNPFHVSIRPLLYIYNLALPLDSCLFS